MKVLIAATVEMEFEIDPADDGFVDFVGDWETDNPGEPVPVNALATIATSAPASTVAGVGRTTGATGTEDTRSNTGYLTFYGMNDPSGV